MARLWVRVVKNHKFVRSETVPCAWGDERTVLPELMQALDLPNPIWLGKHAREYRDFRRTSFTKDHFVEPIDFDRLEIEYLDDSDHKRRSNDPRNAF